MTGEPVYNATVWAVNGSGYIVKLYTTDAEGVYSAWLKPRDWKVYVEAPNYEQFEAAVNVQVAEKEQVKAPLVANSRTSVISSSGLAGSK